MTVTVTVGWFDHLPLLSYELLLKEVLRDRGRGRDRDDRFSATVLAGMCSLLNSSQEPESH